MPTRNAVLDRHLSALETAEQRAARQLATVYNQARREIVADLISGWNQSAISGPADAERFLRNSGLLSQIDARMKQLEQQVNLQLRGIVTSSTEAGIDQIRAELALLPASIRDNFTGTFDQINNRMVERFLYPAEDGVRLATSSTALTLRRELAVGVVQGEAFPTLVRRLMAATPTGEGQAVWVNGQLSAERMVRRTVISAENGAKVEAIGEVAAQIPQVRKQAIAAIGKNTTDCCLRVHGQIQPVSEPFELVGEPRFGDRIMHSPFHWSCRTAIAMYHPAFEESSPTAKMQAEAKAELARRREAKERKRQAADEQAAARVLATIPVVNPALLSETAATAEIERLTASIRTAEGAGNEVLGDQLRSQRSAIVAELQARRVAARRSVADMPPRQFASNVMSVATNATEGVVGGNKVFISQVYDDIKRTNPDLTLEKFKAMLLTANQQELITLARADLAYAFERTVVERSEIQFQNSVFHFIRTDR